jgi:hypothetical protein
MANDNQGSRTFLAIVLGGIVLALVIAAYFMYGNRGDTGVKVETPATESPATETPATETPAPPPETPAPEAPAGPSDPPGRTGFDIPESARQTPGRSRKARRWPGGLRTSDPSHYPLARFKESDIS